MCQSTLHPCCSLLIPNLHKSHEKKKQKSKEVERSLSCGSLMQGENSGLPLKGFSEDFTTQSAIKVRAWKFLCQETTSCIFLWLESQHWNKSEFWAQAVQLLCCLCSRTRAHRDKLGTRADSPWLDHPRTWNVFRTRPTFSSLYKSYKSPALSFHQAHLKFQISQSKAELVPSTHTEISWAPHSCHFCLEKWTYRKNDVPFIKLGLTGAGAHTWTINNWAHTCTITLHTPGQQITLLPAHTWYMMP